jgi:5-oxoprolinase (ATP-hydrolysing)
MTNTRITDPEVLERRYPVILRRFELRAGSGGQGKYRGGDGVTREFEFLQRQNISILSERRAFAPRGIFGGGDAQRGLNLYYCKKRELLISLGGKNNLFVNPGDRIIIHTPGGGAYGSPSADTQPEEQP